MINDRIEKIAARVQNATNLPEETKKDLLELLSGLKTEVEALAETHEEDAHSIARFADVSTHETIREQKNPELVKAAVNGLNLTVQGLETSHPVLVHTVNRLALILSNMGI